MILRVLLLLMSWMTLSATAYGQERTYYLFANLNEEIDYDLYQLFLQDINKISGEQTVLSLGDNKISNLQKLKDTNDNINVKFLTGNTDQKNLGAFKILNKKNGYKYLTDGQYCPHPQVMEIDEHNLIISINSNWFLDRNIMFKAKNLLQL